MAPQHNHTPRHVVQQRAALDRGQEEHAVREVARVQSRYDDVRVCIWPIGRVGSQQVDNAVLEVEYRQVGLLRVRREVRAGDVLVGLR